MMPKFKCSFSRSLSYITRHECEVEAIDETEAWRAAQGLCATFDQSDPEGTTEEMEWVGWTGHAVVQA